MRLRASVQAHPLRDGTQQPPRNVCYHESVMAIPNVKRFRPFCDTCKESFTVMAVIPNNANVDAYLADVVARHDHKAFMDAKNLHTKVRVGQQKQKKAK
jgi:hypothetical protein